jgi:hypothetical protein
MEVKGKSKKEEAGGELLVASCELPVRKRQEWEA